MSKLIDNFANRLSTALSIRNIKPSQLAEHTGIDKSKISSYMSGRYKAKQDGIHLISQYLNIDPAWLMGYDVPMERTFTSNNNLKFYGGTSTDILEQEIKNHYGDTSINLLNNYNKLNEFGKKKANENVEDLTKIQEYTEKKTELSDA